MRNLRRPRTRTTLVVPTARIVDGERVERRPTRGQRRLTATLGLFVAAFVLVVPSVSARPAQVVPGTVGGVVKAALILGSSVQQGTAKDGSGKSLEEEQAQLEGFTTTVVSDAQWDAMTAAQFKTYQLLIIGDPSTASTQYFQAALQNKDVWEPVVLDSGGNRVVIGVEETGHASTPNRVRLTRQGLAFAGARPGSTGVFISLSASYYSAPEGTPVPLLDGLSARGPGQFTVTGAGCGDTVSIVAQSGPTSGLHKEDLQGWGCSVHETFDKWPSDWSPLVIATESSVKQRYCANDVDTQTLACGAPYILIAGSGISVTSEIALTPATATNPVGTSHTVTATVQNGNEPASGIVVTFTVDSGPNAGKTGTGVTDGNGQATFTYTDTGGAGTDTISGQFTNAQGAVERGTATKEWVGGGGETPATPPSISVGDVSVTEGSDGNKDVEFPVTLSSASSSTVTVDYQTVDGTAKAGQDFNQMGGTVTFAPGQTRRTVAVTVIGDTLNEPDEQFYVDLSSPSNATIAKGRGVATIEDDDPRPRASLADTSVGETDSGQIMMVFTVTLDRPSGEPTGVDWATDDRSAAAGSDYVASHGTVGFDPGETAKTVSVPVRGDTAVESNETFVVNLVGLSGVEPGRAQATGTIVDDDPLPPPVFRQAVDGGTATGNVCYQLPGSSVCQLLDKPTQFPIGTLINATNGRVTLTIVDAQGTVQSADFYEGVFVITQQATDGTLVLTLTGGDFTSDCSASAKRALSATSPPKGGGKSVRHLWGDGKGKFRTSGRYSAATVRGTKWLTDDRCQGTLVFVESGIVDVLDLILQRTFTLTAGQSYLAQPAAFLPARIVTQCSTKNGKRTCVRVKLACKKVNGRAVCKRVGAVKTRPRKKP